MATSAASTEMTISIPKARKSVKSSLPRKMLKMTTDEYSWDDASRMTGDGILETVGETDDEKGVNVEMDDADMMHGKGREENNNDVGAFQLEETDIAYEFDDDGNIVFEDSMDVPAKGNDSEIFPSNAKELFQKMPLQAQPHRIRKNIKTMQYECPYCSFTSLYYSAVSNHTLIHTGEKPYQCHLCNYRARQRGHIVIHMRIHSGKKPFKCAQCSYSSIQRNHLRVHMQLHSLDRPFQCPGCSYRSKHLSVLQMHIRKYQHNRSFECDQCDYVTARKHNLVQHVLIHTGVKPFKCDMCPYESSQKGHLNVHIRSHTGEKPYRCHECPFASTVPKSLREHMCMHQGQRPYKCPHCTFSTIQSFSLKKHIALHAPENKTFQCDHCSYVSSVEEEFLKHCTIHMAASPYNCTSCDFTTPFKYQYTTHMMSHAQPSNSPNDIPADTNDDANSPAKDRKVKEKSPSCEMIMVSGKLRKKADVGRKSSAKLLINVGSLVNMSKGKTTLMKNQSEETTSESQSSSRSTTPVPQDTSHSPTVKASLVQTPSKKSKKTFVCLYCDTKLLNQDDWVMHEMRHFNAWPEIV